MRKVSIFIILFLACIVAVSVGDDIMTRGDAVLDRVERGQSNLSASDAAGGAWDTTYSIANNAHKRVDITMRTGRTLKSIEYLSTEDVEVKHGGTGLHCRFAGDTVSTPVPADIAAGWNWSRPVTRIRIINTSGATASVRVYIRAAG